MPRPPWNCFPAYFIFLHYMEWRQNLKIVSSRSMTSCCMSPCSHLAAIPSDSWLSHQEKKVAFLVALVRMHLSSPAYEAQSPADCLCLVYFLPEWESSHGLSWDEAWLYQTTITLHLDFICTLLFSSQREGACVAPVCLHCVFYFSRARRMQDWRKCQCRRKEKDERRKRERKECLYDAAITPHAGSICTLLFVSLLEKSRWFSKPGEAADPFSLDTVLCVCFYLWLSAMFSLFFCTTSTQTSMHFTCVQWPVGGNEMWKHFLGKPAF